MGANIDGPAEFADGVVDDAATRMTARLEGEPRDGARAESPVADAHRDWIGRMVDVGRDPGRGVRQTRREWKMESTGRHEISRRFEGHGGHAVSER